MRALIIDPWNQKVYATDKPSWGLTEMYEALSGPDGFRKVDDINSVRVGSRTMLWVDGEGLLIPNVPIWKLRDYGNPLAGIGLVLGIDRTGDNDSCILEPQWLASMIEWTDQVTTGELHPPQESQDGQWATITVGAPILKTKES